ncbi:hypothetical protein NEAUS06_0498 [Nematocida ausubeli]|nr:hypothetical protein NEAUS06_0498 [Nematocida ausubeli]
MYLLYMNIIPILIMMLFANARIEIVDINTVQDTTLQRDSSLVVNPLGPINPLRGYIYHRNGWMHNMRFFSHNIKAYFSMEKSSQSTKTTDVYNYTRIPCRDCTHPSSSTIERDIYTIKYYETIIKMFPSCSGELSIQTSKSNSFIEFLRLSKRNGSVQYVLAALLLLAEQVDINIEIDCSIDMSLIIRDKTGSKEYVNMPMHMLYTNLKTSEKEKVYLIEAVEVITFFIECKENRVIDKEGIFAQATTKDQFKKGLFLCNPIFLIESYIFEFIETSEDYMQIVEKVHELLCDQLENELSENTLATANAVFKKCFSNVATLDEDAACLEGFYKFMHFLDDNRKFPFYHDIEKPTYTRVPQYDRSQKKFVENQLLYYSNYTETALLGLFCCLAYDLGTNQYTTKHIEKASVDLQDFFSRYSIPFAATTYPIHEAWCKVVACLDNSRIIYMKDKNKIKSGLINILRVISEVTGRYKDLEKKIQSLEKISYNVKLTSKNIDAITKIVSDVILCLSKNQSIEIAVKDLSTAQCSSGRYEIFGTIELKYAFKSAFNVISIDITQANANMLISYILGDMPVNIANKQLELHEQYKSANNFIAYAISNCITNETACINMKERYIQVYLKNALTDILYRPHNDTKKKLYQVMLLAKIDSIEQRGMYVFETMLYFIGHNLTTSHDSVRFTSNLLASAPLNRLSARESMMTIFSIIENYPKLYPNIDYTITSHNIDEIDYNSLYDIFYYRMAHVSDETRYNCLKLYIQLPESADFYANILNDIMAGCTLFNLICELKGLEGIEEIHKLLELHWKNKNPSVYEFVNIVWLYLSCTQKEGTEEMIKLILGYVNPNSIDSTIRNFLCNQRSSLIAKALISMKDCLDMNASKEDINRINALISILQE